MGLVVGESGSGDGEGLGQGANATEGAELLEGRETGELGDEDPGRRARGEGGLVLVAGGESGLAVRVVQCIINARGDCAGRAGEPFNSNVREIGIASRSCGLRTGAG